MIYARKSRTFSFLRAKETHRNPEDVNLFRKSQLLYYFPVTILVRSYTAKKTASFECRNNLTDTAIRHIQLLCYLKSIVGL